MRGGETFARWEQGSVLPSPQDAATVHSTRLSCVLSIRRQRRSEEFPDSSGTGISAIALEGSNTLITTLK